jgi:DnaJ-class molecular chaperone
VSYYDALGLDPSASDQQVKRSYRKKAMETHPDKGGDPEAFKKITEAYEVLSDPSKKSMYDKYGKEGLNNSDGGGGAGNSGSAADLAREIFRGFGGGGFGGGGFGGSAFGGAFGPPPIYLQIELTLEDLFRGKEIPVQLGRSGENGDNHVLKVK